MGEKVYRLEDAYLERNIIGLPENFVGTTDAKLDWLQYLSGTTKGLNTAEPSVKDSGPASLLSSSCKVTVRGPIQGPLCWAGRNSLSYHPSVLQWEIQQHTSTDKSCPRFTALAHNIDITAVRLHPGGGEISSALCRNLCACSGVNIQTKKKWPKEIEWTKWRPRASPA